MNLVNPTPLELLNDGCGLACMMSSGDLHQASERSPSGFWVPTIVTDGLR